MLAPKSLFHFQPSEIMLNAPQFKCLDQASLGLLSVILNSHHAGQLLLLWPACTMFFKTSRSSCQVADSLLLYGLVSATVLEMGWRGCKRKKVCSTQLMKLSILSRNVSCGPTQTGHGQPDKAFILSTEFGSYGGARLHLEERPADNSPLVGKWNIKAGLNKYD